MDEEDIRNPDRRPDKMRRLNFPDPRENEHPVSSDDSSPPSMKFEATNIFVPATYVELRVGFPGEIARTIVEAFQSVAEQRNMNAVVLHRLARELKSQCYFNACKKLYSAMLNHERNRLHQLKSVFDDEVPIPRPVIMGLSMIEEFSSRYGPNHVRDAEILLLRWMLLACKTSPSCSFSEPEYTISKLVWRNEAGKKMVDRLCDEQFVTISKEPFTITVDGTAVQVNHPLITPDEDGWTAITDVLPLAKHLKRLFVLRTMTFGEWTDSSVSEVSCGRFTCTVEAALSTIGVEQCNRSLLRIQNDYFTCTKKYKARYAQIVESVFPCE